MTRDGVDRRVCSIGSGCNVLLAEPVGHPGGQSRPASVSSSVVRQLLSGHGVQPRQRVDRGVLDTTPEDEERGTGHLGGDWFGGAPPGVREHFGVVIGPGHREPAGGVGRRRVTQLSEVAHFSVSVRHRGSSYISGLVRHRPDLSRPCRFVHVEPRVTTIPAMHRSLTSR